MIPLWACVALVGFIACLFYIVLNWRLGDNTSPVLAKIYQSQLPETTIQQPARRCGGAEPARLPEAGN